MKQNKMVCVCTWIGDGAGCRRPTMLGKSYCELHFDRIYLKLFPEMADYIIEKELDEEKINIGQ